MRLAAGYVTLAGLVRGRGVDNAAPAREAMARHREGPTAITAASATTARYAPVAGTAFAPPMAVRSSTMPGTRHRAGAGRRRTAWSMGCLPVGRPTRRSWPALRQAGHRHGPGP